MPGDLDPLDRRTLRLWRLANVLGWAAVAAVAAAFTFYVSLRTVIGFIDVVTHGSPNFRILELVTPIVLGGIAAGAIVGSRVYRWPRAVASASILVPTLVPLLLVDFGTPLELAFAYGAPLLGSGVASMTAWFAYHRRPRALRATR